MSYHFRTGWIGGGYTPLVNKYWMLSKWMDYKESMYESDDNSEDIYEHHDHFYDDGTYRYTDEDTYQDTGNPPFFENETMSDCVHTLDCKTPILLFFHTSNL